MDNITRKIRYKIIYRVVKNKFQDTKLAKRAQTWSNARLLKELGVKAYQIKQEPELRKIKTKKEKKYYARKLSNFQYAINQGLTGVEANNVWAYKRTKIEKQADFYGSRRKEYRKKRAKENARIDRMDLWSEWSRTGMPPFIERLARKLNRAVETPKGAAKFDDFARYGFSYAFYMYVEDMNEEQIAEMVRPNVLDEYELYYPKEIKAV